MAPPPQTEEREKYRNRRIHWSQGNVDPDELSKGWRRDEVEMNFKEKLELEGRSGPKVDSSGVVNLNSHGKVIYKVPGFLYMVPGIPITGEQSIRRILRYI